jgi:hypothetical protein
MFIARHAAKEKRTRRVSHNQPEVEFLAPENE